jgi:uncharacterized protein (TIGR00369 family)
MGDAVFRSRHCFVCGTENPCGLNLAPERDGDKIVARFTPGQAHLGFSKAVHGGITASLLDELVGVACGIHVNEKCATVELSVTYRRPLLEGAEVRVEGWFVRREGKLAYGAGQVLDPAGKVLATAQARFLILEEHQAKSFRGWGSASARNRVQSST